MKFWQGKFDENLDKQAAQFASTFAQDKRLYKHDVMGSLAHSTMLAEQGLLNERDAKTIQKALSQIFYDITAGKLALENATDICSFLDNELDARIGASAEKINIARTNEDRAALNLRLYIINLAGEINASVKELIDAIITLSEKHLLTTVPIEYRNTKGQPSTVAHVMLAFAEMLLRDVERFTAVKSSAAIMPMYSGYGTGTRLPVDRKRVAAILGLKGITANSIDALTDTDYIYEYATAIKLTVKHINELISTLVAWNKAGYITSNDKQFVASPVAPEIGIIAIADMLCQKTAKCAAICDTLYSIDAKCIGAARSALRLAEIVFETENLTKLCLTQISELVSTLEFDEQAMLKDATSDFSVALDCVDYLIMKGASKSDAYEIAGRVCEYCAQNNKRLDTLPIENYLEISPLFDADINSAMRVKNATRLRKNDGEPGDVATRAEIRTIQRKLAKLFA